MASKPNEMNMKNIKGLLPEIVESHAKWTSFRRDLHAHPETAFEEARTSELVADTLSDMGIAVHRGLARTGVVGTIKAGSGDTAIGLRADMDALDILEENTFAHRSVYEGKMHGCGHDGHTTMLLAAAEFLQNTRNFDGTVNLIFQPAEENEGGGREMVADGLFDKFPCEAVFGMHNIPGIPEGHFGVMDGPMMASFDIFDVEVTGSGTHAAWPHTGTDTVLSVAAMVQALQSIASRNVAPLDAAAVSVTKLKGGDTWNTLPERASFGGTTRTFRPEVQDIVENGIRRIVAGQAQSYGVKASVRYERRYPPTINTTREAQVVGDILEATFGAERVNRKANPLMAAEDFAFMLQKRPGCYIWLGNGVGEKGGTMAHKPLYDFNDDIIPFGASYWVHLAERLCGGQDWKDL